MSSNLSPLCGAAINQLALHQDQVAPTPELEAEFGQSPDFAEPQSFMKTDGIDIVGVERAHHDVFAMLHGAADQHVHQAASNACPPLCLGDVDRMFDGEA